MELPEALGYRRVGSGHLDDFLAHFPTSGGLVSKKDALAGFMRARPGLHRIASEAEAPPRVPEEEAPVAVVSLPQQPQVSLETLAMLRQQREVAEETASALRAELDAFKAESGTAVKRAKTLEARLADAERESKLVVDRLAASRAEVEALQRQGQQAKKDAAALEDSVAQLKRDAERVAREAAEAKAREAATATKNSAERARNADANAALDKAQADLLELMSEKGRLAELVEKLIQTNRRLEETSREDQAELKAARAVETQLRQELDAALAASSLVATGSLEQELASTTSKASETLAAEQASGVAAPPPAAASPTMPAADPDEVAKLQALLTHYSVEYVRASDAVKRLQTQLEKAMALLDEKRRANQLLSDGSLELTSQLRALERDRLSLVSQLNDRKRQVDMLRETVDSYAQQAYTFDTEDPAAPASVSAAVRRGPRRTGWWGLLMSCCFCCRRRADETRYTRLL